MKAYLILFLCLSVLWTSGCAGNRKRQVNALERENSQLNGLLWEMEFEIESLQDENRDLKKRLADSGEAPKEATSRPRRAPEPVDPEPFDPGEFQPPTIEFPDELSPDGTIPDSQRPGQARSKRNTTTPVSMTSHEDPAVPEPAIKVVPPEQVSLDSRLIKRIQLASLIGTLHLDEKPGDDGLVIVVEPWDGNNRMLADAADITVVLIDPAEPAATSRYAQWQFDAKEAAKLFREGDLPGLHLELPWPGDPPKHDRLHLFVRYTTSDGRKLETDSLVEVELGGHGRWVATENPRVRPYEQPIETPQFADIPPIAPQLLEADSEPIVAKPVDAPRRVPVRTVSAPRVRPDDPNEPPRQARPKTRRESLSDEDPRKALPLSDQVAGPEPEKPARQRPTWSPDRPW